MVSFRSFRKENMYRMWKNFGSHIVALILFNWLLFFTKRKCDDLFCSFSERNF